jgi:hypothetical protein
MRADIAPIRPAPLGIKLLFSLFLAAHLLLNLRFYGPLNYLWFCDLALLMTFVALWTNNRLLMGMTAVSFLGPAALWIADLFFKLVTHRDWLGWTDYMQDTRLPLAIRIGSAFHIWLPPLLIYCLHRMRYDPRAIWFQTALAIVVLILCRTIAPPPPAHDIHEIVNINAAYGTSDAAPQTRLPAALYLLKLIVKCWIVFYLPTHLALNWFFGPQRNPAIDPATAGQSATPTPA